MYRIGNGFDIHRLEKGKKLILGGIHIDFDYGLKAHSDGDVLIHSLIDSLLGASALGDIGTYFPDTDEKYKNISSEILLKDIINIIEKKFKIINIDCTIICEKPRLEKYKKLMEKNIAKLCNLKNSQINIKAKTMEKIGSIGKEEGIAAITTSLIKLKE